MKIIFLGTGTSTGVPQLGCGCKVCTSTDVRDRRLRTSALIETDSGGHILMDCGPDFRSQMLPLPFCRLDGVFLTHEHYDHTGGLDDLRPFCAHGDVDVWGNALCVEPIRKRMPYCFSEHPYPGSPRIRLHTLKDGERVEVAGDTVTALEVFHGRLPIFAYRIGRLGYVTDMTGMPASTLCALKGVRTLVVNALRYAPHPTHQTIGQAVELARTIGARSTYLVHMSHAAGTHAELSAYLPQGVYAAYDGLCVEV